MASTSESTKQRVHVTLSPETLNTITRDARAANRTLSQQIEHVYGRLATGPERLAELEALAQAGIAKASRSASTAAAEHLAEHARLSGMHQPTEGTDDGKE
jgi:hypothetical protein